MSQADPNPEYWREYSNLQHVKHQLIRHYLNGWFPKMTLGPTGCRQLLYVDTHAGRGTHLSGQLGSPLVALTTLLDHRSRNQMLRNCEVHYFFFERNEANLSALKQELEALKWPQNIVVSPSDGDCFDTIETEIAEIEKTNGRLIPSFIFVDPYGFRLPGKLLRKLLRYPKVELFVNVIWRELDMAIRQFRGNNQPGSIEAASSLFEDIADGEKHEVVAQRRVDAKASLKATLTSVFDGNDWEKIDAEQADDRAEQCADLFRRITGARWGTHLRMLDNGRVRYFLLHLTNHDDGRDLMKECMWKACPDGGFSVSKSDNPKQRVLIQPKPDLMPLREWITRKLASAAMRWQALADSLREEFWRETHLNESLRTMRNEGLIEANGVFGQKQNPVIGLSSANRRS